MAHIEARDITLIYDTPGRVVPGVEGYFNTPEDVRGWLDHIASQSGDAEG